MNRTRVSLRFAVVLAGLLIALSMQTARAATIVSLEDSFDSLDATKFNLINADFEAGSSTTTAVANGQLTLGSTSVLSFWGGAVYQSTDTFSSSLPTIITVDRVSQAGSGTAHRSALQIRQTDGTYMMLSQNVGEGGWQTNANVAGTGANIARLDPIDGNLGNHKMSFAYVPFGGSNAAVVSMVDGFVVGANAFNNWENTTDFNVRVAALSRQTGDTATAVFDNFSAKVVSDIILPTVTATSANSAFAVSNNDLLQTASTGIRVLGNFSGEEGTTNNPAVLTNGTFGPAGLADFSQVLSIHNDTSIIYDLDLAASPLGYDITEIAGYSGWRDAGRDDQDYIVLLSFVEDPNLFIPIANVDTSSGAGSSRVLINASGQVFASGVAGVQFAFLGTENGYVGYREFDVIGTKTTVPEPATGLLGLMGAALLALRRKRAA